MTPSPRKAGSRAIDWMGVVALIAAGLVSFALLRATCGFGGDAWWLLSDGSAMLAGRWPSVDDLAFTVPRGQPMMLANSLSSLLVALGHRLGGLGGVLTLSQLTWVGAFSMSGWIAWRRSGSALLAAALVVGLGGVLFPTCTVRAEALGAACFAAMVGLLIEGAHGGLRRWLAVTVMVFWVNSHPGFPAGLGLMVLVLVGQVASLRLRTTPPSTLDLDRVRGLTFTLVLCAAVTGMNPYGFHLWDFLRIHEEILRYFKVSHFLPPDPTQGRHAAGLGWMVGTLVALRRMPPAERVAAACVVVPLMGAWLASARTLVYLALAAPIVIPATGSLRRDTGASSKHPGVVALILGLACTFATLWASGPFVPTELDLAPLARRLASDEGNGNVLAQYHLGSFLGWHGIGAHRVAVDNRAFRYHRSGVLEDYAWMVRHVDLEKVDLYRIDHVLMEMTEPLARALMHHPEWCVTAVQGPLVLVRRRTLLGPDPCLGVGP